jgi:hypothetical protein
MAIETTSDLSLVGTSQIVDGSVTSAKIASGAVVSAAIAAGAVGSSALATGAVVAASIAAGAVGTAAISSGSATSGQILQANGSGAVNFVTASSGAMTLISTTTLGTSAQEFTISNIPSTYKHLILYAYKLKSSTTTENALVIRWNSVTTSTYNWRTLSNYSSNNTNTATSNYADDYVNPAATVASGNIILVASDGNATSAVEMTFYDYASSLRKFVAGRSTYPISSTNLYGMADFIGSNSGTAAVTSITLRSTSATNLIAAGAVVDLYGVS